MTIYSIKMIENGENIEFYVDQTTDETSTKSEIMSMDQIHELFTCLKSKLGEANLLL